jgi:tryptophan halogenase
MELPDKLASKLELWRSKGRLFRDGQELFGPASWVAILLGQGIVPEEQDPAVSKIDPAMTAEMIDKMHLSYRLVAEQMPPHAEFVAKACAGKEAVAS